MKHPGLFAAFFAAVAVVSVGAAHAEGETTSRFQIHPQDDQVLVTAHGLIPAADAAISISDRLEVELSGEVKRESLRAHDITVKRVEVLYRRGKPYLSVQLRHGRKKTSLAAQASEIRWVGDDLRISIPRSPATALYRKRAAEKEAVAEAARIVKQEQASSEAPKSVPPDTEAVPVEAAGAVATEASETPAKSEDSGEESVVDSPADADDNQEEGAKADADDDGDMAGISSGDDVDIGGTLSSALITILLFAGGFGGLLWYMKRRRGGIDTSSMLDIVASKSLGPKSKIVLLAAGDNELLLAVNEKGTELLTQWRRPSIARTGEDAETFEGPISMARKEERLPEAWTHSAYDEFVDEDAPAAPAPRNDSPLVAGIFKLRGKKAPRARGSAQTNIAQSESDDADWARELRLAVASGAARGASAR